MSRSLPQEQDSVAKFSLEADFEEVIMEAFTHFFLNPLT